MPNAFLLVAFLLYALCAFLPALQLRLLPKLQPDFQPDLQRRLISAGTLLAWLAHAAALYVEAFPGNDAIRLGFATVLSATMWISVAAWWLENRNLSLDGLRVLVLPCAALACALPAVFPGTVVDLAGKSKMFSWHIAVAVLAYSTLTIAAFHAVLMALQESRLHQRGAPAGGGWFSAAIERLPALLTMERLLFRLIAFGFALLTLTVLSGTVFSEQLFGVAFRWDHKTVFTLLSWLLFGALLAGRRMRGWRGRTALSFTLSGFATLFLAYVGSRFVMEVVLHRSLA